MTFHFLAIYLLAVCTSLTAETITLTSLASDYRSATITIELGKDELIVQDTISFATSNLDLPVVSWRTTAAAHARFDETSNMSRYVYSGTVVFAVDLEPRTVQLAPTTLFMHYFVSSHKYPQEKQFNIISADVGSPTESVSQEHPRPSMPVVLQYNDMPVENKVPSTFESAYGTFHQVVHMVKQYVARIKEYVSRIFTSSSSLALQVGSAVLLGVLMSLTPCIYPMIPITIGLLGASATNSWGRNFCLAGAYTVGMSITFAILGLIAVLFGAQCGSLMCHPLFVGMLILFLAYCGGSMLGFYDFYIPRFLQPTAMHHSQGSLVSAFLFGIISGTFASPCMSPGLALVLTAAAQLGNKLIGFLLLFAFGIGVSAPLLIIGTFSGAFNLFPRAGMWMNDVKKFFGVMLIMMCFYYAQSLIPVHIALWGAAIFSALCGTIYVLRMRSLRTLFGKVVVLVISTGFITGGLWLGYRGALAWYATQIAPQPDMVRWHTNYERAKEQAQCENKFLLADFTASWCPMCMLVDKEVLQHPDVQSLFKQVVAVKIDGSKQGDLQFAALSEQFSILGIPQLLLIDPRDDKVVAQWGSELLEKPAAAFRDAVIAKIE